jgi:hypothetical protein
VTEPALWRRAYDAAERRVTPHAERLVRTPSFAVGAALAQRAQALARSSAQGVSARAWHLLNLPAGTDVTRLRAQIGALDREVRRLTVALENERHRPAAPPAGRTRPTPVDDQERHAVDAQPPDRPRPGPARSGTDRPTGP